MLGFGGNLLAFFPRLSSPIVLKVITSIAFFYEPNTGMISVVLNMSFIIGNEMVLIPHPSLLLKYFQQNTIHIELNKSLHKGSQTREVSSQLNIRKIKKYAILLTHWRTEHKKG